MSDRTLPRRALVTGRAAPPAPAGFVAAWADSARIFETGLKAEGVVGGSFYFMADGAVAGADHYGYADLASGRRVDKDTIYHWASNTKTFTAIAFMQLRDRGLASLDDPIVKYVPAVRAVRDPFGAVDQITIRQLLSHAGGFRGQTFPWGGDKPWMPHEPHDWSTIEATFPYTEIEFPPGTKSSYSNLGLSLVGRAIEVIAGQHIDSYIEKNILMPLDMWDSYFDLTPYFMLKNRSNNYYIEADGPHANGLEVDTGATLANGGLNAPMSDFVKYTNFMLGLNDNGRYAEVLSRRTLEEMWRPVLPAGTSGPGNPVSVGLVFFSVEHRLPDERMTRFVGHGGDQMAFHTSFQFNPETRTGFLAAGNSIHRDKDGAWPGQVRDAVYDKLTPLFLNRVGDQG